MKRLLPWCSIVAVALFMTASSPRSLEAGAVVSAAAVCGGDDGVVECEEKTNQ